MIMARIALVLSALAVPTTAYPCAHLTNVELGARADYMAWFCLAQEIFPPAIDILVTNGNCTQETMARNVWPCDDAQCDGALKTFYKAGIDKCFSAYPGYAALFKCTIQNYCGDGSRRLQIQDASLFPFKTVVV
mmetsp:Transcript_63910/g.121066  ORF Transcript_63910/g.121066 Transcript_63910/m.121066 type:complete len:134 (+) Transcript_63910:80-481(+)